MNELEMEEIKKAVEGFDEKPKLEKAELLGIKFVTTKNGADLLNEISRVFDLVDVKQDDSKSEPIITNDSIIDQGKKVKFKVPIDFLDHTEYMEFETTEAGLRHFKGLLDPNKNKIARDQAVEMENLSFYDGVVLVREIFHRIIDECFDSDDKDRFGYEYAPYLYDRMEDILENNVFNHVRDHRAEHLYELFEIRNSQYTT